MIAGKNLKAILDVSMETDRKTELLGKFNKTLNFAEEIQKKIHSDPVKYDIQKAYMKRFSEHE